MAAIKDKLLTANLAVNKLEVFIKVIQPSLEEIERDSKDPLEVAMATIVLNGLLDNLEIVKKAQSELVEELVRDLI